MSYEQSSIEKQWVDDLLKDVYKDMPLEQDPQVLNLAESLDFRQTEDLFVSHDLSPEVAEEALVIVRERIAADNHLTVEQVERAANLYHWTKAGGDYHGQA